MPFLVKFVGSSQILLKSGIFERQLEANAFAREHQNKVPGAAVIAIMATDEHGNETDTVETVKL
jgi:hypothetical protein